MDYNIERCKRGCIEHISVILQRIGLHIIVSVEDLQKAHLHTLVGITMVDLITVHFLYELIAGLYERADVSTCRRVEYTVIVVLSSDI